MIKNLSFILLFLQIFLSFHSTYAEEPVVRAVLFYSPACPHCHQVMEQDLPPILQKYGKQLQILEVNVTIPAGQELFQAAVQKFQIPSERLGVPNLTIGETVLVGSFEIPTYLPNLIEQGL